MKYILTFFLFSFILISISFSEKNNQEIIVDLPYNSQEIHMWADSLLSTMTLNEKIGQLFMVTGSGKNLDELYYKKIDSLIINYKIGGVLFLRSQPNQLKQLLNRYNSRSEIPLLASIDAEWGLGMRLDSVQSFPWMMTMGAVQDTNLIYDFGVEVARQLRTLGLHVNFAPVLDVNNNPNNPIIDRRSFGSDPINVYSKGHAYMRGLQDNNIVACGKHFPGHGDTNIDSHISLPVIYHNRSRLDNIELVPFKRLIQQGLASIMIAHINLPFIDTLQIPATFSKQIIQQILKKEMKFNGLVISDALNMGALSMYSIPGEVELNAFLAGNDVLLCPDNISESIKLIKAKVKSDSTLLNQLNVSCKKNLMIKKWSGVFDKLSGDNPQDLINEYSQLLNKKLFKNALTVLKNSNNILPLTGLDTANLAYVSLGNVNGDVFYNRLNNYVNVKKYVASNGFSDIDSLLDELKKYDIVIVGLHYSNQNFWDKHVFLEKEKLLLSRLCSQNKVLVNIFGHPQLLNFIPDDVDGLVLSYQNASLAQDLTAQLNFGSISANGRLPVSTEKFDFGSGLDLKANKEFEFVLPVEVGVHQESLLQIDSLVNASIKDKVMPGCQIVASRYGKVFYNKAFGYHTYDSVRLVDDSHLYDIASITKIASAAPIIMEMVDRKLIKLHKRLDRYSDIPLLYDDKKNLKIIDIFTHQAQLFPWIPFWQSFTDQDSLDMSIFSYYATSKYNIKVSNDLFFSSNYLDTIYKIIYETPLLEKKEYKYSDLGFYLIHPIVEKLLLSDVENYVYNKFYKPIEAFRITYNPLFKYPLSSIVPTENDKYFRNQLIHGYVHDQGASLFGGVALHAGLFSNAIDLMKLMQLYLNDGYHLDERIISKKRIQEFTQAPFQSIGNRRGIIFDKPSIDPDELGPTCDAVSALSFGHSGFTGTLSWADPEEEIVYIFLSNGRVFPNGNNTKLLDRNIRTEIQKIIYNSLN